MSKTFYGDSGRAYYYDDSAEGIEFADEYGNNVHISGADFRALVAGYITAKRISRLTSMSDFEVINSML